MFVLDNEKQFYFSDRLEDPYKAGFGTKRFDSGWLKKYRIIELKQIHSNKVAIIENYQQVEEGKKLVGDGLVTALGGLVLLISTADCLPIIYVDRKEGLIAISHNGWQGSGRRISQKIIATMISLGATVKELIVLIGPSIGECCYSIDEEREKFFRKQFPFIVDKIISHRQGLIYLNLPLLNYLQLRELGIKKEQIDFSLFCTQCQKKTFFSYRRRGKKGGEEMTNFVFKNY